MKTVFLVGSPRRRGNSFLLADRLREGCGAGSESLLFLDTAIGPCIDCKGCKSGELRCVVKDGMTLLYDALEEAEAVVIASPIYWFGPSAQTKLFLDRLRPYAFSGRLKGKRAALILPSRCGPKDCELTIEMFKCIFDVLGMNYLGAATPVGYDEGEALQDFRGMEALTALQGLLRRS